MSQVLPSDPRPLFEEATSQVARLIASVRPDQYELSTPCSEFDVRRLVSHCIGGMRRIAVVGEGGDGNAVVSFADEVPDAGLAEAYDAARADALKAWQDEAVLDRQVSVPWGKVPGRGALSGYVLESSAHAWDLREALGRTDPLPPEPAVFALAFARQTLPAERRGADVPFDEVVPAPEGADAHGELAAWLGRRPLGRP
ncbi:TIGR03086 family metal-binding protein [Streptomyces sp. VRA16 Mangrove soil]|uniref:TIGR03086 family metal-binding protein n=1 Tax=Streptomyces sp. VRA16 Mangrove soil TaxID=2817434 RepID=UPI001A9DA58E|nr:TIGR03086 family metal-binding protein [Streptomyces sp. VRA16 Mangrove soil]MBO1336388.1 TIGR03086 family protein [Streptomyces sp. VRA16 Mangrove soil]